MSNPQADPTAGTSSRGCPAGRELGRTTEKRDGLVRSYPAGSRQVRAAFYILTFFRTRGWTRDRAYRSSPF
jgi:hypothetical protein